MALTHRSVLAASCITGYVYIMRTRADFDAGSRLARLQIDDELFAVVVRKRIIVKRVTMARAIMNDGDTTRRIPMR